MTAAADRIQLTLLGGPARYVRQRAADEHKSAAAVVGRALALLELLESMPPGGEQLIESGELQYRIYCQFNRTVRLP
jgi:hypothetical protein